MSHGFNIGSKTQATCDNAPKSAIVAFSVDDAFAPGEYGKVRLGKVLAVRPEAPFVETYNATVKVVDRVIDSASGTFRIRLELPNPSGKIPAGIRCTLALS